MLSSAGELKVAVAIDFNISRRWALKCGFADAEVSSEVMSGALCPQGINEVSDDHHRLCRPRTLGEGARGFCSRPGISLWSFTVDSNQRKVNSSQALQVSLIVTLRNIKAFSWL